MDYRNERPTGSQKISNLKDPNCQNKEQENY